MSPVFLLYSSMFILTHNRLIVNTFFEKGCEYLLN